jgi:hypothetical protein
MVLDVNQCRSEALLDVSAGPGRTRGRGTEAGVGQARAVSRFVTSVTGRPRAVAVAGTQFRVLRRS